MCAVVLISIIKIDTDELYLLKKIIIIKIIMI